MRWVTVAIMMKVMPNPYNQVDLIKRPKAQTIFNDIKKVYLSKYKNTWDQSLIPLEFFAKEFCSRSGQDEGKFIEMFENYFVEEERKLHEKSQ